MCQLPQQIKGKKKNSNFHPNIFRAYLYTARKLKSQKFYWCAAPQVSHTVFLTQVTLSLLLSLSSLGTWPLLMCYHCFSSLPSSLPICLLPCQFGFFSLLSLPLPFFFFFLFLYFIFLYFLSFHISVLSFSSLWLKVTLCLVGVNLGRMENIRRKIERKENPRENFLSRAHKFFPPKSRGKAWRENALSALLP